MARYKLKSLRRWKMSMFLKQCPNCNGDLLSFIDENNFKVNKCAQCSREFNQDSLNNNNLSVNQNIPNEM